MTVFDYLAWKHSLLVMIDSSYLELFIILSFHIWLKNLLFTSAFDTYMEFTCKWIMW